MVCAKCQKALKTTQLATPGVRRKQDLYYGSPAGAGADKARSKSSSSATLGATGVTKSKLLGKAAKNPLAAYASACRTCKSRTEQGRALCNACAYRAHACAVCGKDQAKAAGAGAGPVVQGQKFTAK